MNEQFNADNLELAFSGDVDDGLYYDSDSSVDIDMLVNQR